MAALSKLVIFSSFMHQVGFVLFSSLDSAIGTVHAGKYKVDIGGRRELGMIGVISIFLFFLAIISDDGSTFYLLSILFPLSLPGCWAKLSQFSVPWPMASRTASLIKVVPSRRSSPRHLSYFHLEQRRSGYYLHYLENINSWTMFLIRPCL